MDWNKIAEQCNTTAGAASKRYSRMKQAFEAGGGPPGGGPPGGNSASPALKTPSKATPKKAKAATTDGEATPTPKRKRATLRTKAISEEEKECKPELEFDGDEDVGSAKKAKVASPKATPKPKVDNKAKVKKEADLQESMSGIKNEIGAEIEDFVDAQEWMGDSVDAREWVDELVGGNIETDEEGQAMRKSCQPELVTNLSLTYWVPDVEEELVNEV
jgi:hypothetical protein